MFEEEKFSDKYFDADIVIETDSTISVNTAAGFGIEDGSYVVPCKIVTFLVISNFREVPELAYCE